MALEKFTLATLADMDGGRIKEALAAAGAMGGPSLMREAPRRLTPREARIARTLGGHRGECLAFDGCTVRHRHTGQVRQVLVLNVDGVEFLQGSRRWVAPERKAAQWLRNCDIVSREGQVGT